MFKNQVMESLLNNLSKEKTTSGVISKLLELFWPEFIEWDECVLLSICNNVNELPQKFVPNSIIIDRTQYEATNNHIHIVDFIPELENYPIETLLLSLKLLEVWGMKLKSRFPMDKFHLVISYDEFGSVIRFYKVRSNETPWLEIEKLDDFKEEAILVEEI